MLWIDGRTAQEAFSQLRLREDQIKQELGKGIFFEKSPGGRAFKILEKKPCKLAIRNEWGAAHEWLKERGEAYVAVFAPIVRRLKLD